MEIFWCLPIPGFFGRQALKVLVRAHVVVKPNGFLKGVLHICCALMNQLPQPRLDSAEESLYPSIAPGAQTGVVCLRMPANFRNVVNTKLLKMASLSVRTARGLPC